MKKFILLAFLALSLPVLAQNRKGCLRGKRREIRSVECKLAPAFPDLR